MDGEDIDCSWPTAFVRDKNFGGGGGGGGGHGSGDCC